MKTISVAQNTTDYQREEHVSLFTKFFNWCKLQENDRLLWLGIILTFHGCILTPLTVMAVLLAGTNLTLFIIALAAMGIALVTNLAAMPTKITIPVFALSILIDLVIVGIALAHGFDISSTSV